MKNLILKNAVILTLGIVFTSLLGVAPMFALLLLGLNFTPSQVGVLGVNLMSPTVLQDARYMLENPGQEKFEDRLTQSNILDAFLLSNDYLIPQSAMDKMKQGIDQPTKLSAYVNQSLDLLAARSLTPTGVTVATQIGNITFAEIAAAMFVDARQILNNDVNARAAIIARVMRTLETSILVKGTNPGAGGTNSVEIQLRDFLETNRTQVSALSTAGISKNVWAGTPDFLTTVTKANEANYWDLIASDMELNNYSGEYLHVVNTADKATWRKFYNQGAGNATNSQYQFDGHTIIGSNLITPASGHNNKDYVIPRGGVGIVSYTHNDKYTKAGFVGDNFAGGWQYQTWDFMYSTPIYGRVPLTADLIIKEAVTDSSSLGGGLQSPGLTFELTLKIAIIKQPLSTAGASPIFKYAQLSA